MTTPPPAHHSSHTPHTHTHTATTTTTTHQHHSPTPKCLYQIHFFIALSVISNISVYMLVSLIWGSVFSFHFKGRNLGFWDPSSQAPLSATWTSHPECVNCSSMTKSVFIWTVYPASLIMIWNWNPDCLFVCFWICKLWTRCWWSDNWGFE